MLVRQPTQVADYLMSDRDRHGNSRLYVRRHGRKVRVREKLGTEAFAQAYADALRALEPSANRETFKHASAGTLGWVAANYFSSVEFRRLDPISQRTRRAIIEDCLREPRKPGVDDLCGTAPSVFCQQRTSKCYATERHTRRARRTIVASGYRRCSAGRSKTTLCG